MLAVLFLVIVFFHGLVLANTIFQTKPTPKFIAGFIFGTLICVSLIYWISCITKSLDNSLICFFIFSFFFVLIFRRNYLQTLSLFKSIKKFDIAIFLGLFAFSFYLFAKSFGYDNAHGNFLIASNVYLDFGAHIPFIRSFSMGNNFPGEVPFFQNSGLLYYFLFDFFAGVIEHLGLRIDIAYNFISAISFTLIMLLIYQLAVLVFKNKIIGVFSVLFFLFNSNLSFLTFFKKYGLNAHIFFNWWHNNFYLEGQPTFLDKTIQVAGFWNLNPYINQRHLVFGIAFFLFFLYVLFFEIENKKNNFVAFVILGVCLGFLPMWHTMIFIAIYMVSATAFFLYPTLRKKLFTTLFIGGLIALPQLFLIKLHSADTIVFQPGFLLDHMLTLRNELLFWFVNLGLGIFTIIFGFLLANKNQKKFFLIFLPLFIIPNLIHLSSRFTFDDHKYFNVWIIGASMFSALFMAKLLAQKLFLKVFSVVLAFFLCLSGLISIMVIKNDIYTTIPDYPKNAFLAKAKSLVPNNSVVITNGEIYDPITLIGKKTFIGRVQYIFVYGGDASQRLLTQKNILEPESEKKLMQSVKQNNIQYIVLYKNNFAKNEKNFNQKYYDKYFKKLYEDKEGIIYKLI